jgi:hypothetical protein
VDSIDPTSNGVDSFGRFSSLITKIIFVSAQYRSQYIQCFTEFFVRHNECRSGAGSRGVIRDWVGLDGQFWAELIGKKAMPDARLFRSRWRNGRRKPKVRNDTDWMHGRQIIVDKPIDDRLDSRPSHLEAFTLGQLVTSGVST